MNESIKCIYQVFKKTLLEDKCDYLAKKRFFGGHPVEGLTHR